MSERRGDIEKRKKRAAAGDSSSSSASIDTPARAEKKGASTQANGKNGRKSPVNKDGAKKAAKSKQAGDKAAEAKGEPAAKKKSAGTSPGGGPKSLAEEYNERHGTLRSSVAWMIESCGSSLVVHLAIIVALGLLTLTLPNEPEKRMIEVTNRPEELVTERLDEQLDPAETVSMQSATGAPSFNTSETSLASDSKPQLSAEVMEAAEGIPVTLADVGVGEVSSQTMSTTLDASSPGEVSAVVDGYDQAFDRLTQEILLMLDQGPVLVMWLFDESESMKDDQQEIRARIGKVYQELGLTGATSDDSLLTAVASYGEGYHLHTNKPTWDLGKIETAMDQVPIDKSGKEMMCPAIGQTIQNFRNLRNRRQMALILVSDESGEPESNLQYLEPTIAVARETGCRIYTLGREAVFGYPYAHMRWRHPITGGVHWLPINRGPETAFVEQLQTEGFRRRYDAHPSGFGPYEQIRMAYETGGIFFMLPSLETNLVRGEKRIYELEAMRPYKPDLRSRQEYLIDRNKSVLRSTLWKVIGDLNPYDKSKTEIIELRLHFSPNPESFAKQVQKELGKAEIYTRYLIEAENALEQLKPYRQQETSPRWQANYDLLYAQVMAYKVRTYEYGAYLTEFMKNPKVVPLTKPPNLKLAYWDIIHRKETVTGELTESTIAKSQELFRRVIYDHPGTPWAARAEWELKRGFGVGLHERYHGPSKPRPSGKSIPIPKL